MNKNTTSSEESNSSSASSDDSAPESKGDEQSANGQAVEESSTSTDSASANASATDGNPTDGLPEKMSVDENLDPPDLGAAKADEVDSHNGEGPDQSERAKTDEESAEASAEPETADAAEAPDSDEKPVEELPPEQQVLLLQEQLSEQQSGHKDELLRMQAEMQNQRKRLEVQSERARKFALEGFAKELLEVKDSLEMGLEAAQQEGADVASFVEGADLTLKKLSQSFEKHNIAEINPMDEKFNPELHEAMSQAPVEGKEPNTVIGVIQKGYTLNGRIIRAARVMVAK